MNGFRVAICRGLGAIGKNWDGGGHRGRPTHPSLRPRAVFGEVAVRGLPSPRAQGISPGVLGGPPTLGLPPGGVEIAGLPRLRLGSKIRVEAREGDGHPEQNAQGKAREHRHRASASA